MFLRDARDLEGLCEDLRATGRFALDTEFVRERVARPRLGIVQVAWDGGEAIIDAVAIPDLSPLGALVADPEVEKVLHAAGQDMEILHGRTGKVPARIFDTQIAAGLVGLGERLGYAALVEALLGVELGKGETYTEWTRRPLTSAQLAYALDDVRHLLAVRDRLAAMLAERGRLAWAEEEFRRYEDAAAYERDPREAYRRVRRAWALDRRALAILREVAAWREEEAEERDRPRGSILSDETLLEIARRAPTKAGLLAGIRGVHPRLAERSGPQIIAAVRAGLSLEESERPEAIEGPERDAEAEAVAALLLAWVRARALEEGIGPGYLATPEELLALARAGTGEPEAAPRVLAGWRRDIVGRDLVDLLEGRARLSLDPAARRLRLEREG